MSGLSAQTNHTRGRYPDIEEILKKLVKSLRASQPIVLLKGKEECYVVGISDYEDCLSCGVMQDLGDDSSYERLSSA